ncbi:MAG: class I SAM-dependent methyltransferase [Chloroflexota bacterium]
MNHADYVNLIKKGIPETTAHTIWADLGSGRGAFTLALADCIGAEDTVIHSIDIDIRALKAQETHFKARFPTHEIIYKKGDFTQTLDLPPLDGIIMANSIHFVQDKVPVLKQVRDYLKPDGRLIVVEYDTSQGNYAVPYPITYSTWTQLTEQAGFSETTLLATRPSRFLGQFFSALSRP